MKKRILSVLLIVVLLMTFSVYAVPANAAGYDSTAATKYAKKNWNNGKGLCAEFVSDCLSAGGCGAWDTFVSNLRNELAYGGWGTEYVLTRSGNYVYQNKNSGKIAAGDPILFWCKKCTNWVHAAICGGVDSRGIVLAYGHNEAWNAIDNFATYMHGTSNNLHTGNDIVIYSVRMNAAKVNFTSTNPDNYEIPKRSLKKTNPNMIGSDVCWVQTSLKKLGYTIGIDGVYGAKTEKVVRQFQTDYSLTIDGIAGPKTVSKLQTLLECSHSYSSATCTKPKTCKLCGKTSGSANGHKYKTTTTKATLSKNGKTVKKCKVCNKVTSTTIKYAKTFKLSTSSYTYNGKAKTPSVTVKDSAGKTLKKDTDYTVTYASGRKNVGTYKVTIKMKGKYSGTKTLTFKIGPVKTSVSKLTAGKKSITVNISKKSTQVTGYQIQYSTSKSFKNAKTKTISSYKTTKYTLKSLSAKKTYYVRVRTYKTVYGKKYYSGWSTAKSVKTK